MEYVDGEDLASLLRRIGRLPADKAIEIARQLCAGLAAAHDAGVLHRDLKPANVMIDGRGRARITDFGLAGLARRAGDSDATSSPARRPTWRRSSSPGRARHARSDIYALGLVLYELFTGQARVRGAPRSPSLRRASRRVRPVAVDSSDRTSTRPVERVILRCLETRSRAAVRARPSRSRRRFRAAIRSRRRSPRARRRRPRWWPRPAPLARSPMQSSYHSSRRSLSACSRACGSADRTFMVGGLSSPLSPEVLAQRHANT